MLKVVVDTNVFIAGLLKDSTCRKIINNLKDSKFLLITSPDTLNELIGVLARPKFHSVITREIAQSLIDVIKAQSLVVKPRQRLSLVKEDPDDNRFLEVSLAAKADCIVSGDNDILALKNNFSIPILTASEFLKRLKES